MIEASNINLLEQFSKLRRGLNLTWVDGLKSANLGTKQAIFLRYLSKHPGASQADLSRATMTDPAAANRALDSLVKKSWVKRVEDPDDRRRWKVELTREGAAIAKKVDAVHGKLADGVFGALKASERKVLNSLLNALIEALPEEIRKEISE